jgi:hypothetical protein
MFLLLACAVCTAGLLLAGRWTTGQVRAAAADEHVTVIVQPGSHGALIRRVPVTGAISGLQALELSGLAIITTTTSFGTPVCSIAGVGCPADDCFCSDGVWTYQFWNGTGWEIHATGPDASVLTAAAIDGWRWSADFGDAPPPAPQIIAAADGLDWLAARQSAENGSYGDSAAASVEALLAVGANQVHAGAWRSGDDAPSLAGFLMAASPAYAKLGPANAGKLGVAAAAGDVCLPDGAATPLDFYTPGVGYDVGAGLAAWAMLGAAALSETIPVDAVTALEGMAFPTGGWEWQPGFGADTNTTSLAIQALVAAGRPVSETVIQQGLAFLATAQNADGGFAYDPASAFGTDSDANSTAYAVQALVAANEEPTAAAWTIGGQTPIDFLLARRLPDGSLEWQAGTGANQLTTQQAIPALLGASFPVAVTPLQRCADLRLPALSVERP